MALRDVKHRCVIHSPERLGYILYVLFAGGVISYSSPVSDDAQGLYDCSYDGHRSQGVLFNGLGRLVDGEIGLDNFRLDIGYGKGGLSTKFTLYNGYNVFFCR